MKVFLLLAGLVFSSVALGQSTKENNPKFTIDELRWVDNGFLERQRTVIDEIGRSNFGTRVRKDTSDLRLLQRILDEDLVNQTQIVELQAMGVVLGDVYVKELGLEWKVYLDQDGKSRAVCLPKTTHCLFPVTMISKRATLGVKPNIQELYKKGVSIMSPYLPKVPYSSDKDVMTNPKS
jgi:hypothetical protein